MELSINRRTQRDSRRFSLSGTSKKDPSGAVNNSKAMAVTLWADVDFVFAVGVDPSVVVPSEATPGDVVWPAKVPVRLHIPAGEMIAAAALTGTGNIVVMPGV